MSRVLLPLGILGNALSLVAVAGIMALSERYGFYPGTRVIGTHHGEPGHLIASHLLSNIVGVSFITFLPYSLVCIWRCAPNVEAEKYRRAVRRLVVLSVPALFFAWGCIGATENF